MNNLFCIIAQAAGASEASQTAAPASGGGFNPLILMLLFLGAMYFLMIAPQRKRQKQHEKMLSELESGDSVITIGGIYGKITNKTDKTFTLKVSDTTKIEILKSAVAQKVQDAPEAAQK